MLSFETEETIKLGGMISLQTVSFHVYPVSILHVPLHPSPSSRLPSSHSYEPKFSPSPHFSVHVPKSLIIYPSISLQWVHVPGVTIL